MIQRVGGSLGTAILAVILQHQIAARIPGATGGGLEGPQGAPPAAVHEPLTQAFATTFWWSIALTLLALVPTLVLVRATRKAPAPAHPAAADAVPG